MDLIKKGAVLGLVAALLGLSQDTMALPRPHPPEIQTLIQEMHIQYGFSSEELSALFDRVHRQPKIIGFFERPTTSLPWYRFKAILINEARVQAGVRFWRLNAPAVEKASAQFGVDPAIVIAILGVETGYGKQAGTFKVLDVLTTLVLEYPRRAAYFREELVQALLLAREEKVDPLSLRGSYAGAMGMPQFMPGSYRKFAVDLDGNGRRDIWNTPADAIGSIARYLAEHGWEKGGVFAAPLSDSALNKGGRPFQLKMSASETQDWIGFQNFESVMKYNKSVHYAMAVWTLAERIRSAK